MITIRLFCAGGMSTSILMKKIEEAAVKKGLEVDVKANPAGLIDKCCSEEKVDVALIGPQVAYEMNRIKPICEKYKVPVEVIPMLDYGRMNGEKVLDLALGLIKNK